MRHLVPIDGQTSPAQIRGTSQPHAAAFGELAEFVFPVRNPYNSANTLTEIYRAQPQKIGGHLVWSFRDSQAQIRRVDLEFLGDFVELYLLAEARLRSTVPALGPAGGLVGERSAALKAIARNMIGRRLKRSGVIRACNAVRTVGAAVNQCL